MPSPESPEVFRRWRPLIEEALASLLPPEDEPSGLGKAMRYSMMAGGKRIRPILAIAAYEAAGGVEPSRILEPVCALEMFHTYSLIHDDLPAMDDDDLRRGVPTSHRVFGEAMAILAGDALQSLGAELLAGTPSGDSWTDRRNEVCRTVFGAIGWAGMAGGQALDLEAEGRAGITLEEILRIHSMKTGRMLEASLETGAILAGATPEGREAIRAFGRGLGLAFQIVDDVLDVTSTTGELGKTAGKDLRQGKATFPSFWGVEGSRREAGRLLEQALDALDVFGDRAGDLAALARFVVERDH